MGLLLASYAAAVALALRTTPAMFHAPTMAGGHLLLAAALALQAIQLERRQHSAAAVEAFYRGIWRVLLWLALPSC